MVAELLLVLWSLTWPLCCYFYVQYFTTLHQGKSLASPSTPRRAERFLCRLLGRVRNVGCKTPMDAKYDQYNSCRGNGSLVLLLEFKEILADSADSKCDQGDDLWTNNKLKTGNLDTKIFWVQLFWPVRQIIWKHLKFCCSNFPVFINWLFLVYFVH